MKSAPMPLKLAQTLKKVKSDQHLNFEQLGNQVGLSGALLSSRIIHCEDNPERKPPQKISRSAFELIKKFLDKAGTNTTVVNLTGTATPTVAIQGKKRKPKLQKLVAPKQEVAPVAVVKIQKSQSHLQKLVAPKQEAASVVVAKKQNLVDMGDTDQFLKALKQRGITSISF